MEPIDPPPPPDSPGAPPPLACPRCGAPHEPDQEYCLECGHRLPSRVPAGGYVRRELWARDSPAWLWATLVALALVALVAGAIAAVAATRNDGDNGNAGQPVVTTGRETTQTIGTITNTTPITVPSTTGTTETILPTGPTTISVPTLTTNTFTTATTTTSSTSGVRSWPAGKDGYTIVLASVPTSHGRAPADRKAENAISNGLPEVGVLNSSDYLSLNPGYWVVFTGIYDSKAEAESHLATARSFQPLAYVRPVTP